MALSELERHPISLIPSWFRALGPGWNASFSRYLYTPHTVEDTRILIKVPLDEITPAWLQRQVDALPPGFELAMHSRMTCGRVSRHIPMVDFAADVQNGADVVHWASNYLGVSLHLFASGRSFHAYGVDPVSHAQWVRFMGLLLLGNLPDAPAMVDSRWIGHRLLAGYSALRWTKNSPHYVGLPTSFASSISRSRKMTPL